MKKLLFLLFTIIAAYLVYQFVNVYWMLAFLGLWLAFGITLLKFHLGDALRLWGIVLGILVIMLGGAVILAREWSELAAGAWIFISIVLLFIFQNKIKRMIPIFYLANAFEKIVHEKSERNETSNKSASTRTGTPKADRSAGE